ncbi:hypothetical protein BDM02DRAFT_3132238 [Thelephora ganbajun]|uniref:Uncharacterized protein n=1 Tax=Thelephora ganbajun TaxID=370292 RepID=A0ACB6Z2B3_THEGA|nr:hypothetical protein BDM02DRAFT_3132238 [Thelephora ganbajun]
MKIARKIARKIEQEKKEKRTWWSFEYFPPRTVQDLQNLVDGIEHMRLLSPDFTNITCKMRSRGLGKSTDITMFWFLKGTPQPGRKSGRPSNETLSVELTSLNTSENTMVTTLISLSPAFQNIFSPPEQFRTESKYLKAKIDLDCSWIFTQMFLDVNLFIRWATRMANTVILQHLLDVLEPIKNNDENRIHEAAPMETVLNVITPGRRNETIRPIFWANHTKSHIARTKNWDEYPNSRFGDVRSPMYGEIDGYGVSLKQTKEEALKIWGSPTEFGTFKAVFRDFCLGKVPSLPWSEQGPSSETEVITKKLAQINDLGFLTINSQPAVNGVSSDDKVFGWGPGNGFVYQKVILS